jgi:ubiquinone/menaquinone biosynthesis C-methylase UbiE
MSEQMQQQSPAGAIVASPYDGLATHYNRGRPGYPEEALADIRTTPGDIVVDVGAGTGIFTRRLAVTLKSASVVGVEPSGDMRREADAASAGISNLTFVPGSAESLPFAAGSVTLVTAATAAHWFDRPNFYGEAFRCLRHGGTLLILQNVRRWRDSAFLTAYEELHEFAVPGYQRDAFPAPDGKYKAIEVAEELSGRPEVAEIRSRNIDWSMSMTEEVFVAFSLSSTITQRAISRIGSSDYLNRLRVLLSKYSSSGSVELLYVTRVTQASRNSMSAAPARV